MFRKFTQVIGFKMPEDANALSKFMEEEDGKEWKVSQDTQGVYFKKESFYDYSTEDD